jgi:hypothetical protein
MKINLPSQLSDDELVVAVKSLARCEREATASLIAHLAELDARRLFLGAGFSSLFTYCCSVLHLSEPAAYNRIEAARTARRFPVILRMLGEGSLSVATVRLLSAHLTADNHQQLVAAATGKSKRQVEELLVRYFPQPAVPSSVRRLPAARPLPAGHGSPRPSGRGPVGGTAPGSRDIAAKVRRVVWPRDHGTCAFISKNGRRCNESAFIEFDHIHPYGARGEGTTENIRLLCRAHNAYESERFYGRGHPAKGGTRPGKSQPPPP